MKSPLNTAKQAKENPRNVLKNALLSGGSEAIEQQEKRGQLQLVGSQSLPTEGLELFRETIESNGGKIGDVVADDPIFTLVELPDGWEKETTDHSMWSKVVDKQGRPRASVFYKAAFYDRSAHISPDRRFYVSAYEECEEGHVKVCVKDACGEVTQSWQRAVGDDGDYAVREELRAKGKDYLDEHWPDWESPNAYWDESSHYSDL